MIKYQVQMAEVGSGGEVQYVNPKNRDIDTELTYNVFGSEASQYGNKLSDGLNYLNKKFNNYVAKGKSISKATSCVYSTSCNFANASSSCITAKNSTYSYTADKATYDSLGRNIINTYISTSSLTTIYTSTAANNYPFSITGLTNMRNVFNSKFNNYLLRTSNASNAARTGETTSAKCDQDGNVISTTYLPKTTKISTAKFSERSTEAMYTNGNASYATTGLQDSHGYDSCAVLRYVKTVNISSTGGTYLLYTSNDISKENLLIFDTRDSNVYVIFNGLVKRSLKFPHLSHSTFAQYYSINRTSNTLSFVNGGFGISSRIVIFKFS